MNNSSHSVLQPSFQGCMQLIQVDDQLVNLYEVAQRKPGSFANVSIDMCAIIDRCVPNHCEHGGKCSQTWDSFKCTCDETGYTGATCHNSLNLAPPQTHLDLWHCKVLSFHFLICEMGAMTQSSPQKTTEVKRSQFMGALRRALAHTDSTDAALHPFLSNGPFALNFCASTCPYHTTRHLVSCRKTSAMSTADVGLE
ncbi:Contactin-associated protein-like 2 [Tupaia chinensis]|uniref:Contactin-associated protein-like 2 n=1 Tax=Tupaia chinensis TaxID=246437 RepID=L9LD57_TUPCH|nr:Contactin-associated protein-like 2 [Tupaia chinensis]